MERVARGSGPTTIPVTIGAAVAVALALLVSACRMDSTDSTSPSVEADGRVPIGDVRWYVDYDAAVEVAREEDKALWVHFGENPG